jgi:membrane-associated phospholipid phosphatase
MLLLLSGLLLAAAAVCFFVVDERVFSYLRENPPTWNKNFCVQAFKQLGKVYAPVWLLLFWAWITGKHKTAIICFLSLLITMAAVLPVKTLVRRLRPKDVIKAETKNENETKLSRSWSFPSGDTASVFAVGTILAFAIRRPFIPGLAACCGGIGILRVAELAHYPSDVFGGAALGILCGWAAMRIRKLRPEIENIFKGREEILSFIGVIIIPILVWIFQGPDNLKMLLEFYFPAGLIISVAGRLRDSSHIGIER